MTQAAMLDKNVYQTDMVVGDILRRAREERGQSLADVERDLRIRASQIHAIEQGDIERLPGRVYAIGFVRSYAEYLQLDGNKMVSLFKAQSGSRAQNPELHFPIPAKDSKLPSLKLIAASLIATVALIGYYNQGYQAVREELNYVPSVEEVFGEGAQDDVLPSADLVSYEAPVEAQDSSDQNSINFAENVVGTEPAAGVDKEAPDNQISEQPRTTDEAVSSEVSEASQDIILNIIESSWVEITNQEGRVIVSRVLDEGDQYFVPHRPDLKMSLGNAGGVRVNIGEIEIGTLGQQGEVIKDIVLDATSLQEKYQPVDSSTAKTTITE